MNVALMAAALLSVASCRIVSDTAGDSSVRTGPDEMPAFERVTEGELVTDGGLSRGVAWGDFDGDGWPDLVVANTTNWPEAFYRNAGDGTFTEIHEVPVTLAAGWTEGVHPIDHEGDGDLDLHLTNTHDEPNPLFRNDGADGLVRIDGGDLTRDSASTSQACWADYDADGDLDAFVANRAAPDALYENRGDGTFERLRRGRIVEDRNISAGAAWADYDRDGDLDLYVANWGGGDEDNALYRNRTSERTDRGWILIHPVGSESNRMALGARVRALATIEGVPRWQTRWMLPATGYASANEPVIHFGLGDAARIDSLEVLWPSGTTTGHGRMEARREWVVTEQGDLLEREKVGNPLYK